MVGPKESIKFSWLTALWSQLESHHAYHTKDMVMNNANKEAIISKLAIVYRHTYDTTARLMDIFS